MAPPSVSHSDAAEPDASSYDIATARRSSFRKSFEQHLNEEMSGPSKRDSMHKAALHSPTYSDIDDVDYDEKKHDKCETPPRFSTLFPPPIPIPTPVPVLPAREFESYPKRKSGIYLPTPVFWALLAFLLMESAILFASTTLGLLSRFQLTTIAAACPQQPIINISPNFLLPGGTLPTALTSITTSTSTTLPAATSAAMDAKSSAAAASAVLSALTNLSHASSTSTASKQVTTITVNPTPTPNIVSSTTVLTVDPSGHTLPPVPTVTSTQVIAASDAAAAASSSAAAKTEGTETTKTTSAASITTSAAESKATTATTEVAASITAAPDLLTSETTTKLTPEATSTSTSNAKCIGAMGRMGNQDLCP